MCIKLHQNYSLLTLSLLSVVGEDDYVPTNYLLTNFLSRDSKTS